MKIFLFILLFLLLFLFFSISPVHAEWVVLSKNDKLTNYIESNSLRHKGKLVTYWTLVDYSSLQTSDETSDAIKWFSSKVKSEDNCDTEETRTLSIVWY
jgi:hypothetical protein